MKVYFTQETANLCDLWNLGSKIEDIVYSNDRNCMSLVKFKFQDWKYILLKWLKMYVICEIRFQDFRYILLKWPKMYVIVKLSSKIEAIFYF